MKYISLVWEAPRALLHFGIAFANYLRGRGFTDEP